MTDTQDPRHPGDGGAQSTAEPSRPELAPDLLRAAGRADAAHTDAGEAVAGAELPRSAEVDAIPLRTRVEALLFAATEPLSLARMRNLAQCDDPQRLREVVDALALEYDDSDRAFALEELAGGLQLRTRADLAPVVARLGRRSDTERLSPAAVETLAIVAYKQPVLRVDVERIRGVASGEVLRGLVERDLAKVAGRAELPGAPLLYGTTARFLKVFGLGSVRDLPTDPELLRPRG